jgi:hypothetical protein
MIRLISTFFLTMICVSAALADEIELTSGKKVTGQISEQTAQLVKMIDPAVGVPVTYYMDEITSINGAAVKQPELPPAPVPPTAVAEPIVTPGPVATALAPEPVQAPVMVEAPVPAKLTVQEPTPIKQVVVPASPRTARLGKPSSPVALVMAITFAVIAYLLLFIPYYILANKTGTANSWMAFVPILNMYLAVKIASRPGWWCVLLFIPLVGFVIWMICLVDIAKIRHKPAWVGILFVVPIVGFFIPWYLAISDS